MPYIVAKKAYGPKSNQLFGPYGNTRYNAGSLNTAKGFIGQYNDGTGLDYFNACYYDPIVGVFLAADTAQGNAQEMNPYGYVNGNPETRSDPSGRYVGGLGGQTYYPGKPYYLQNGVAYQVSDGTPYTGSLSAWLPGHEPNAQPSGQGNPKIQLLTPPKPKLPTESQIHKAQSIAATAAAKFSVEGAALLAISAFLPEVVAALETIASQFDIAAGVAFATLNWIAAPIFLALGLAATALAAYVAKSAVTLAISGTASLMLGAIFAGRAIDANAHDWTPAALDQFAGQAQNFTLAVRLASGVISFIDGNGIVRKLIGVAMNVSTATYAFAGLDSDLAQMRAAVGA